MRMIRTCCLVAALAGALPAEPPALPSLALPAEFDRVLRDYEKAWRARDAAGLAALFSEDGHVLAQGRSAVRGRAAIQAAYTGSGGPLALRGFAFGSDGRLGYILGGYGETADGPERGKFTLLLIRGAGDRWLILSDMDNPSTRGPR